jgi:hypothetical protein
MPEYKVHVYREMRIVFDNIEADSIEAAADIAASKHFDDRDDFSDCEGENLYALVDYAPHEGTVINFEGGRLLDNGSKLITLCNKLLSEIDAEIEQRQHGGNDEDWAQLKALSDETRDVVREATGGAHG